jgi:hypothetical protein
MNLKDVNPNKLSVTDVIAYLGKQLEQNHGVELSANALKNVFVEAITRSIVLNEIEDMMLFISDEDKHDKLHSK